ncbi:hypothetical protein BVI2075_50013 [Burkholderia vietnamiensis]|nr:hypothetical protein BVI2075_50013 [Burkholderia vietnamiensis]
MGTAVSVCRRDAFRANVDLPARAVRGARATWRRRDDCAGKRGNDAPGRGAGNETAGKGADRADGFHRRAVVSEHAGHVGFGIDRQQREQSRGVDRVEHTRDVADCRHVEHAAGRRAASPGCGYAGFARERRRALVHLEVAQRAGALRLRRARAVRHPRRTQITFPSRTPRSRRTAR